MCDYNSLVESQGENLESCVSFFVFVIISIIIVSLSLFLVRLYQISIFVTYYAAVSISTGSMVNFGLYGYALGLFLVLFNVLVVLFAVRSAWKKGRAQRRELERKAFLVSAHIFLAHIHYSVLSMIHENYMFYQNCSPHSFRPLITSMLLVSAKGSSKLP
jgi:hypothetical protein